MNNPQNLDYRAHNPFPRDFIRDESINLEQALRAGALPWTQVIPQFSDSLIQALEGSSPAEIVFSPRTDTAALRLNAVDRALKAGRKLMSDERFAYAGFSVVIREGSLNPHGYPYCVLTMQKKDKSE